jgi:hypothetical protein
LFETIHLGGQGNDLGVGCACLTPAPICHTIGVEDTKFVNDGILVGHPPYDSGRFGKAHINGKELIGGGFCSTKKLSQKLVVLAELFSLLSVNFLLKSFREVARVWKSST